MPNKLKGDPVGFFIIHSIAKHQKIERGPFGKKSLEKKYHNVEKKTERGNLYSRPVLYITQIKDKIFWFSSLSEMVQFDTIKLRRTF